MQKYRSLHMVSTLLRIMAWIVLLLGLLAAVLLAIGAIAGIGRLAGALAVGVYVRSLRAAGVGALLGALLVGLGSVLCFIVLLAASDMARVLMDIEENTRSAAYFMGPKP
jgi:hypothetical protein